MATKQPSPKNASATEHAGVTEHTGYNIYGEPYPYFRCESCHAEWTPDTPGDGCESCR